MDSPTAGYAPRRFDEEKEIERILDEHNVPREEDGVELALFQRVRIAARVAGAVPPCPECGGVLIHRASHRCFMEDDHYQECINGHVWEVKAIQRCPACASADVSYQAPDEGRPFSCNNCGLEFFKDTPPA